jgi:hypothetical protein
VNKNKYRSSIQQRLEKEIKRRVQAEQRRKKNEKEIKSILRWAQVDKKNKIKSKARQASLVEKNGRASQVGWIFFRRKRPYFAQKQKEWLKQEQEKVKRDKRYKRLSDLLQFEKKRKQQQKEKKEGSVRRKQRLIIFLQQTKFYFMQFNCHFLKDLYLAKKQALKKYTLNYFDKITRFYQLQQSTTLYAYKAFIVLELQLNTLLLRTKLIPFLFLARDLCYYLLVRINEKIITNPYTVLGIYDTIAIPIYLYRLMYCRQYLVQAAPWLLLKILKAFWQHITTYTQNKIWLLANFIVSFSIAMAFIFMHPNLYLYKTPLRQLTRLYYRNHPITAVSWPVRATLRLHRAIKLRVFDYSVFF